MTGVTLGLALPADRPVRDLVAAARQAEALGYGHLWVNDDRLQRDPFAVLAALAAGTERITLGPGVTNPYARHPALIATAIATIDELSGGRAVLGLGTGGTNHRALGVRREAPAAALREAVTLIRGLLAGREVTLDGRVVKAGQARLDFAPVRPDVPIYLGARGPRVLEAAGEAADGVIVGNLTTPEGWSYALNHINAGAKRGGRAPELVAWFYCSVSDDHDAAVDAVRPMVATSLATSRPVLDRLGVTMPPAYAALMEEQGWSLEHDAVVRAGALIPEEIVARFALAGTPERCRRTLRALLAAFPEIAQVTIVPFAPAGGDRLETVRRFRTEVVAQ